MQLEQMINENNYLKEQNRMLTLSIEEERAKITAIEAAKFREI